MISSASIIINWACEPCQLIYSSYLSAETENHENKIENEATFRRKISIELELAYHRILLQLTGVNYFHISWFTEQEQEIRKLYNLGQKVTMQLHTFNREAKVIWLQRDSAEKTLWEKENFGRELWEIVCRERWEEPKFCWPAKWNFEISLSVLAKESSAKIKRHRFMF